MEWPARPWLRSVKAADEDVEAVQEIPGRLGEPGRGGHGAHRGTETEQPVQSMAAATASRPMVNPLCRTRGSYGYSWQEPPCW